MSIYIFMLLIGIWVFSSNRKHLLVTFKFSIYCINIMYYFMMVNYLNSFNFEFIFSMVFLTFSVCEDALGLSNLLSLIRNYGNDYFQTYSMLQCCLFLFF